MDLSKKITFNPHIPKYSWLIFFAVLGVLGYKYGYLELINKPPQSIHLWRQTNGLSITQMYYQYNTPFAKTEIHNQLADDATTGKSLGEFPILYYVVAQLWKIFDPQEGIFRFIVMCCGFLGFFYVFKFSQKVFQNSIIALFLGIIPFTSPVIANYTISFLPNLPSMAFVLIAWYFAYEYFINKNKKDLWICAFYFCLAMLLKTTAGISFITLLGIFFVELIFIKNKENRFYYDGYKSLIPFTIALIIVYAWYSYVIKFNLQHGGEYTYTGLWPIWKMTNQEIDKTIDLVKQIWLNEYYYPKLLWITLALWFFNLVHFKKLGIRLWFANIVMMIGGVFYILFWFKLLDGHDYYMIEMMPLFILTWGLFFCVIQQYKINYPIPTLFILGYIIFVASNHCAIKMHDRYTNWMNEDFKRRYENMVELAPELNSFGIGPEDKIISLPDYTICGSLYLLNRKGYTDYSCDFSKRENLVDRIHKGARFLVINDTAIYRTNPAINEFTKKQIGTFKNITMYDLSGY